jgi:ubiquinone/menaquinone biosynthesis C-methylase UbiE/DNA-binding transcriptional ArsR family regulator
VTQAISTNQLLAALKAAGEATRLRVLALLERGELNVTDLTLILGQSQPRISRHLRLLDEAGLIERFREGSFVYCRLAQKEIIGELVNRLIGLLDAKDEVLRDDRQRAARIKAERIEASQIWFKANAAKWDQIRSLYVAESKVEEAMLEMLHADKSGDQFGLLFDLGTGTGRVLELFADKVEQAIGIDASHSMLEYARSRLAGKKFEHCQLRQGDLIDIAYNDGLADIVILHQVLHFLIEPEKAVREAARLLQPGGQLLIVDFAPHNLDFLREEFAHERLGFSDQQMSVWLKKVGLVPKRLIELSADEDMGDKKLMVSLWLAQKGEVETSVTRGTAEVIDMAREPRSKQIKKLQGNAK